MSVSSASSSSVVACRWEWCRDVFETADRLAKHVLDEHVSKEIPVRRTDVRLEMRTHDGTSIGEDSIRTSLLMNEDISLGDEDKEVNVPGPSNGYTPQSPIHQRVVDDEVQEVLGNVHAPSLAPQFGGLVLPLPDPGVLGPSNGDTRQQSMPVHSVQSPSSSPEPNGFRALADSSSCSPDPDSMSVAPAPSLAEMLANTFNNSYSARLAGPSAGKRMGSHGQPIPLSPKQIRKPSRPSSATGLSKTAESQMGEISRPLNGADLRPPSSYSRRRSRSRSQTSSNSSSHMQSSRPCPEISNLPLPIVGGRGPPHSQSQTQSDTQSSSAPTSSARPFRLGSIRLEPNLPPEAAGVSISSHANTQSQSQFQSQGQSETQGSLMPRPLIQPPQPPQPIANIYIDDIDILSPPLEPSIPAFSQASDMQNQSQWPLATQAPYSFDSQLAFSSQ